jgi:hypothetical protein
MNGSAQGPGGLLFMDLALALCLWPRNDTRLSIRPSKTVVAVLSSMEQDHLFPILKEMEKHKLDVYIRFRSVYRL